MSVQTALNAQISIAFPHCAILCFGPIRPTTRRDGGPLQPRSECEDDQRSFDATCKKPHAFLSGKNQGGIRDVISGSTKQKIKRSNRTLRLGQAEEERGPDVDSRLQPQTAAVALYDLPARRQANSGAWIF